LQPKHQFFLLPFTFCYQRIYKYKDVTNSKQLRKSDKNDCRDSEQKLLGGSSASSSDPDLASLDIEEEAGGGINDTQQDGAVATDNPSEVQAQAQVSE